VRELLTALADRGRPLRVGVVGAGKFATMFLVQTRRLTGLEIGWVADVDLARARHAAPDAVVGSDAAELIAEHPVDVVVEATGSPTAGAMHALAAIEHGRHVVMVTVEGDVLAGPALARRAAEADVVYTLAYGDQPALVCELVEWARVCGFEVVCAGKGTRHEPGFHLTTPDDVWERYGARVAGADCRMFTSFTDGTKSAIELAAVCNATGLEPQEEGLRFPRADRRELPLLPALLSRAGTVEAVAGDDLRWAVFVVFAVHDELARRTLAEYGIETDPAGRHAALYRPYHFVGLELAVSVLRAGLRGEATGAPHGFRADAVAVAKRDLGAGETLDGEGGYCAYGTLVPAARSIEEGLLPIGLTHGAHLTRAVAAGEVITLDEVELPADETVLQLREETVRAGRLAGGHRP
jgi:predicted homoserine dehydrogenase-like protein